jgi:hypothetical protein
LQSALKVAPMTVRSLVQVHNDVINPVGRTTSCFSYRPKCSCGCDQIQHTKSYYFFTDYIGITVFMKDYIGSTDFLRNYINWNHWFSERLHWNLWSCLVLVYFLFVWQNLVWIHFLNGMALEYLWIWQRLRIWWRLTNIYAKNIWGSSLIYLKNLLVWMF